VLCCVETKAFNCKFVSNQEHTVTAQGASLRAHMDYEEAMDDLEDFDVLIIPGGNVDPVLEKESQPMALISAFAALQGKDPSKERTLMSVCTGSLMLAKLGLLQGLGATTHPDYYTRFEIMCQEAARKGDLEQTDVMEVPYVVNNARFALGEEGEENPFIYKKKPERTRRKSIARKGSNAWMDGQRLHESIARRATLKLGGLRVITSGGISTGMDASLYLVSAMVSYESAEEVARDMQYDWKKGVTVDGIDV